MSDDGQREGLGLAESLIRLRKERGYSQQALGNAANVSPTWVSNLEKGRIANPGAFHVYRLALVLRVSMEELMGVSSLYGRARINRKAEQKRESRARLRNAVGVADTIADDDQPPGDSGQ